jgi:hypothetical protein
VQAVNRERKPIGRNNGTSEPYTFSVKESEPRERLAMFFPKTKTICS